MLCVAPVGTPPKTSPQFETVPGVLRKTISLCGGGLLKPPQTLAILW